MFFMNTFEDVPLVEFMYLVFTCTRGESYHRWHMSLLLYLCYVFWALIVRWFCTRAPGLILLQFYEHLLSASSWDELWVLHNGSHITILCFGADPQCNSRVQLWRFDLALHCTFWKSTKVVTALFSWYMAGACHIKLLPSQHKFSVYHTTMHQFTMSFYLKFSSDMCYEG